MPPSEKAEEGERGEGVFFIRLVDFTGVLFEEKIEMNAGPPCIDTLIKKLQDGDLQAENMLLQGYVDSQNWAHAAFLRAYTLHASDWCTERGIRQCIHDLFVDIETKFNQCASDLLTQRRSTRQKKKHRSIRDQVDDWCKEGSWQYLVDLFSKTEVLELEERRLIDAIKNDNAAAEDVLFRRYSQFIKPEIQRSLRGLDPHTVVSIRGDTIMALIKGIKDGSYTYKAKIRTFLYTIVEYKAKDAWHRKRSHVRRFTNESDLPNPDQTDKGSLRPTLENAAQEVNAQSWAWEATHWEESLEQEREGLVELCIEELPDPEKDVVLRILKGEPKQEIAQSYGRARSWVTARLKKTYMLIRACVECKLFIDP